MAINDNMGTAAAVNPTPDLASLRRQAYQRIPQLPLNSLQRSAWLHVLSLIDVGSTAIPHIRERYLREIDEVLGPDIAAVARLASQ